MKKVNGYIGVSTNECQLWKLLGHSNSCKAHEATINRIRIRGCTVRSLNEEVRDSGAKTKITSNQSESQLLLREVSKVGQKVSAFGPAHAEKARKLYLIKGSQSQHMPILPNRSDIQLSRHIVKSHHQDAEDSTNEVNSKDPIYYGQRVLYRNSKENPVSFTPVAELNQPILKIVTILPRPKKECVRRPKSFSDAGEIVYSREGFVKKESLSHEDKVQHNVYCSTILQILEEISSSIYTPCRI